MANVQDKSKTGRKRYDTVNGEKRDEKFMMYFTPTLLTKVRAWCRLKGVKCNNYITSLIEADIAMHKDAINQFFQLSEEMRQPETLSPCPFCGGNAKLHQAYDSSYNVQCETCGNRTLSFKRPEEARQAWNNRSESQT